MRQAPITMTKLPTLRHLNMSLIPGTPVERSFHNNSEPLSQPGSSCNDALFQCFAQGFGTARDVQLLINICQMEIHGPLAHVETSGYFFVAQATRQQAQYL